MAIRSFRCADTEALFATGKSRRFGNIARIAVRKLDMLEAAEELNDLRVPPGNRLEALKGNRTGQFSIRVNEQWRICLEWDQGPSNVEIVDYHR